MTEMIAETADPIQVAVDELVQRGKDRGFVTWEEMNEILPDDAIDPMQLEMVMMRLEEEKIETLETVSGDVTEVQETKHAADSRGRWTPLEQRTAVITEKDGKPDRHEEHIYRRDSSGELSLAEQLTKSYDKDSRGNTFWTVETRSKTVGGVRRNRSGRLELRPRHDPPHRPGDPGRRVARSFRAWRRAVRSGRLRTPRFILHVDGHHDMMDEQETPHIANFLFHAMRRWERCQVHWLVENPIDEPDIFPLHPNDLVLIKLVQYTTHTFAGRSYQVGQFVAVE